jgi:phosphoglycerol transferase
LVALLALWVSRGELWPQQAERSRWRHWRLGLSVLICLVLGATGFYYAFFACFFLLVAGVLAVVQRRDWRGCWLALGLIAIISAGVVVNLLPSILYFSEHGNVQIVRRQAGEADYYGLRIAQLLLPVRWHRLQALEDLKTEYNQRLFINENDDASLGFVGVLGF